jgi:tetratricopeptide (TPR) repeat protein
MNRRRFLGTLAAAPLLRQRHANAAPFPVNFRKASPHETLAPYILPGHDEFAGEKAAMETAADVRRLMPGARVYVLPEDRVRFELGTGTEYRVGVAKARRDARKVAGLTTEWETVARSPRPLFRDVTAELFGRCDSFREQLARGVPYWRAALDSASGIDIYGANGIAVGDIDGDGADEVYVCQPGGLPNRLYKLRDGRFEDITARAGVGLLDDTSCALFLDLRNRGAQDLVVLRASGPVLFLNQGDGAFALRADAFRFRGKPQGSFTGMAAADYDRDGRLDLYLCSYTYFQSEDQYRYPAPYHDAQNGPPNFLFRNALADDGSGGFEDVTEETGLNHNNDRFSFAPAWCDYDGDGWPDLYVANDFGRNNLYRNRGGKFEDVAREAGVEDLGPGMSAAWFDYDGDGRPDLYVSNMWSDAGQRVAADPAFKPAVEARDAYRRHTKGNSLYRNRGDGTFEETTAAERVEMGRWAWSADAHDFDNDGAPEIYVTCGMLTGPKETDLMSFFWRQVVAKSPAGPERSEAYERGWNAINQLIREDYSWNGREPNVFYARHDGRYQNVSGISGLDCALDSRAFAVTDLDGDGNLDLLLKSRLGPQVKAFRNESTGGRKSIAVRLTGTKSNRDAIGARVEADGVVRWLAAGSGYLSQHTKTLHFGLGEKQTVETLRVTWPSGARQEFRNLAVGLRYDITEGSQELRKQAFAARAIPTGAAAIAADNRPRTHDTWLLDPVPLPEARTGPGLLYVGAGEAPKLDGPVEVVNLRTAPADVAASYALFRRYLLDWRTELDLPLALLIDERSRVHKLYAATPDAATLAADLRRMRDPDRQRLALPFPGDYIGLPHRNYFKLGAAFYQAGYPDQALPYLEETVRQMPANDKALNAIGQIHLDRGRPREAREYLERAVAANPALGEGWNNLGGVELGAGNLDAALRNYRRAIELLPRAAYPLVNAGEVEARQGRMEAAVALFKQALVLEPKDAGAINNLGVSYSQMNQTDDAIAAFEYGIRVAPDDETLYMNLGRIYVRLGRREKARDTIAKLLERKPESTAAAKAMRELETAR